MATQFDLLAASEELSRRYAAAVDNRDFAQLAAVFTPDARLVTPAGERVGVDAIVAAMEGLRRYERTQHRIGELAATRDGDGGTGTVECVAHHLRSASEGLIDRIMTITYHDRYVATPEGWRIAERRLTVTGDVEEQVDP